MKFATRLIVPLMIALCHGSGAQNNDLELERCAACHGDKGISSNELWPNLAGQQVDYLVTQMQAFRDGTRSAETMTGSLDGLSDQQLKAIAVFYNAQSPAKGNRTAERPGAHVRARCVSCHAMSGISVTSQWPNLKGQKAGYIQQQLQAYKSGERVAPLMNVIAGELSDQQIADVAQYFGEAQ